MSAFDPKRTLTLLGFLAISNDNFKSNPEIRAFCPILSYNLLIKNIKLLDKIKKGFI